MVKNPIIRSCDLDLWPMTLKFNRFRAVITIHVCAKFHRATWSGSWVILHADKTSSARNNAVRLLPRGQCRSFIVQLVRYLHRWKRMKSLWAGQWLGQWQKPLVNSWRQTAMITSHGTFAHRGWYIVGGRHVQQRQSNETLRLRRLRARYAGSSLFIAAHRTIDIIFARQNHRKHSLRPDCLHVDTEYAR